MRIPGALLVFLMSAVAFGQSIPYGIIKTLDDCANEWRQTDGFTAEIQIKHSEPKDTRAFELWLETPEGRQPIEVNKDGTFRLPAVQEDERQQSRVVHSLEKGALDIRFRFDLSEATPAAAGAFGTVLSELCSDMADKLSRMDHLFLRVDDVIPGFKDVQIAVVGVSFPRDVPLPGAAVLKQGDRTVASIDLSQTGKVSWMFADYDPRTHRVVFEMKDGAQSPKINIETRTEKEAFDSKHAIWVRKRP